MSLEKSDSPVSALHTYIYIYVYIYVYICVCVCIYLCACVGGCIYIYMCVCVCVYVCLRHLDEFREIRFVRDRPAQKEKHY